MATIPEPNMVPTIPSGALPQTPVSEWADNTNDLLGGHVTRTPVGTPGPAVPGRFFSQTEPDPESVSNTLQANAGVGAQKPEQEREGTSLLATAQATLAAATTYLPPGLAAYLPSNPSEVSPDAESVSAAASESSFPPLPPSSPSVSASSVSSLPRQDTTESTGDPQRLDSSATGASAPLSTMVHTGHSSSAIAPSPNLPRATSGLHPSHPGAVVASDSASSTTQSSANDTPQLVQSPTSMSPSPSAHSPQSQAQLSSSDLKPSHPGVASVSSADSDVHALHLPTHIVYRGHPHPTPHAVPVPVSSSNANASETTPAASTPSLVPSTGGDSGYTASTEGGTPLATPTDVPMAPGIAIQGSAALNSSRIQDTVPTGDLDETSQPNLAGVGAGAQGSAALNSSRLQDTVPTGDLDQPSSLSPVGGPGAGVQGSAALNSSRLQDTVPTGDLDVDAGTEGDFDEPPSRDEFNSQDEKEDVDAGAGKTKSKKPKLMQRLKEKMHVGGGGSS
ncbi:hypothetical protein B0H12DRAFT_1225732 [Mycena haematopus]|nr:hypothetical protein B0H12DRAFT_1225732 [Mycena haematopus]